MLKSVIALIAGFAIMTFTILVATIVAVLAMDVKQGEFTAQYLAVNAAYTAGAAVFGGYSTATLAPERPTGHAMVLALMILVMNSYAAVNPQPGLPAWYTMLPIVVGPVCAVAGGKMRELQKRRQASAKQTA